MSHGEHRPHTRIEVAAWAPVAHPVPPLPLPPYGTPRHAFIDSVCPPAPMHRRPPRVSAYPAHPGYNARDLVKIEKIQIQNEGNCAYSSRPMRQSNRGQGKKIIK
ncbi:Protein of unknown function [Gryllus bimaculatus]|nr:Protein of unknown function [Gryllus bimaculatus]